MQNAQQPGYHLLSRYLGKQPWACMGPKTVVDVLFRAVCGRTWQVLVFCTKHYPISAKLEASTETRRLAASLQLSKPALCPTLYVDNPVLSGHHHLVLGYTLWTAQLLRKLVIREDVDLELPAVVRAA